MNRKSPSVITSSNIRANFNHRKLPRIPLHILPVPLQVPLGHYC